MRIRHSLFDGNIDWLFRVQKKVIGTLMLSD